MALCCCENNNLPYQSDDLYVSVDTVRFDTVFSSTGSTTQILKLYNPTSEAIRLRSVSFADGRFFRVNIDGETDLSRMAGFEIGSQDSMFVFLKVFVDPTDSNTPVLISDRLIIQTDVRHEILLEAYGQDVTILDRLHITSDTTLADLKPYLVRHYLVVDSGNRLTIAKGTTFFMGDSAQLVVRGELTIAGTLQEPVVFRGSRTYHIYDKVPYDYVSGLWGGIYIIDHDGKHLQHQLDYVDIHGANVGLYCLAADKKQLPQISVTNSRIHNHSMYGIAMQNFDSEIVNTEVSNCASYCVYLAGGTHRLVHNTIASYFNSSSVVLHSVARDNVSALFVNNLSKNNARTVLQLTNCIVAGLRQQNFTIATPMPQLYSGTFCNNCLRSDSVDYIQYIDNYFLKSQDTLFVNTYFDRNKELYYDFRLDSASVARNIADTTTARLYPIDRLGHNRFADGMPDAGCYEWTETTSEPQE